MHIGSIMLFGNENRLKRGPRDQTKTRHGNWCIFSQARRDTEEEFCQLCAVKTRKKIQQPASRSEIREF